MKSFSQILKDWKSKPVIISEGVEKSVINHFLKRGYSHKKEGDTHYFENHKTKKISYFETDGVNAAWGHGDIKKNGKHSFHSSGTDDIKDAVKNAKIKDQESINEGLGPNVIPAPMIVLRRVGVRTFPDGRKVAMYSNDKYNLIFTVPFGEKVETPEVVTGVSK